MYTVVRSVKGATVPRAVRTRARGESMSEWLIITVRITHSFTKCMAVVEKPTHLNDINFVG